MFRGRFEHTIDDKGRLSVPAKFRDFITASNDDRVVVTNFQSKSIRCLDIYPYQAWVRLEERVAQRPQFDPRIQDFEDYYFSGAHDCQLDKQGRILLPPTLRQHAQLERAVMITGSGEKFRVWTLDGWKQVLARSESALFEDPAFFKELGI